MMAIGTGDPHPLVVTSFFRGGYRSVLAVFVVYVLYVCLRSIYRLTFHPLARYHGPLFGRISDWSIVFQAASGNRHLYLLREHEKYGSVVRIGPNTLSINTPGALREIYADRKGNVQKSEWYRTVDAASEAFSTHSEIDKEKHAFKRRILDHAFSDSAVRSAEVFIAENIQAWCEQLGMVSKSGGEESGWTEPKNMDDWSAYLNYDIMGDLTFGKRFNCIGSNEHRRLPELMVGHLPFAWLLRPLLKTRLMEILGGKLARDNIAFIDYANSQMDQRIEAEKAAEARKSEAAFRKDFMHYILQARDAATGKGFTVAELHAESSLLIFAGADTTATSMAAAFFYLLHNPRVLSKLTAEIRSAFSSVSGIRGGAKLNSLVYLRAFIDETLRYSPPVASHIPREVLPGGLAIDATHYPAGTVVGTSAYTIHHTPAHFPDPWTFRPERWIPSDETGVTVESVETQRAAFCPFSLGSRGCIGKSVAYLTMSLSLASVLWRYDIRMGKGGPSGEGGEGLGWGRGRKGEYQLSDRFSASRNGPMVEFRRRNDLVS